MRGEQSFGNFLLGRRLFIVHSVFLEVSDAGVLFELLFLDSFLDVLEDTTDELISFGLGFLYPVFETFDLVVMSHVDVLVQEEEFAVLCYDVGQVVLFGLTDILEPEQISLV